MDRRIDIAVAAAFLCFGLLIAFETSQIPNGVYRDIIGSKQFLYLWAAVLIVGAPIIIGRRIIGWQKSSSHIVEPEGSNDEEGYPSSILRPILLFLLCVVYAVLFETLGYLISTPIFIFAGLAILQQRRYGLMAAIAIVFTAIFYLAFAVFLDVRMPADPITQYFTNS
jgi:putative tricarboxylic transport membrane protein